MHRPLFASIPFILTIAALGQSPVLLETMGVHAAESYGNVQITGSATDEFGNSFVAFTANGTINFGTTTLQCSPFGHDFAIAKLNANGTWAWAKKFSGSLSGSGFGGGVALDGLGGMYVAPLFFTESLSYDGAPITLVGAGGLSIAKLDTSGTLVWVITSEVYNQGQVVADQNGRVYVGCSWNPQGGVVHIGTDTLLTGGDMDLLIAKVDPEGAWSWAKNFPGGEKVLVDMAIDTDGDLLVAGHVHGSAVIIEDQVLQGNPGNDAGVDLLPFVGKWAMDGTPIWLSGLGAEHKGGFEIEAVELASDGGAQVLGVAHDTADFAPYQVISDGWTQVLVSIDTDGNWTSVNPNDQYGGWVFDMVRMNDATLACVGSYGQSFIIGSDSLQLAGANDVFAALLSSDGSWLGGVGGGSTNEDLVTHVTLGGGLLRAFGTTFGSPAIFGSDTLTSPGGVSAFISTLEVSSVGIQDQVPGFASRFFVYPVPAADGITISSASMHADEPFSVFDQFGRPVMRGRLTGTKTAIAIQDLAAGCYVLRSGARSIRFIKE